MTNSPCGRPARERSKRTRLRTPCGSRTRWPGLSPWQNVHGASRVSVRRALPLGTVCANCPVLLRRTGRRTHLLRACRCRGHRRVVACCEGTRPRRIAQNIERLRFGARRKSAVLGATSRVAERAGFEPRRTTTSPPRTRRSTPAHELRLERLHFALQRLDLGVLLL